MWTVILVDMRHKNDTFSAVQRAAHNFANKWKFNDWKVSEQIKNVWGLKPAKKKQQQQNTHAHIKKKEY